MVKKYITVVLFLFLFFPCYSEEIDIGKSQDIEISSFQTEVELYGLPQRFQLGWFYRKNDFSIFPNVGFFFDVEEESKVGATLGFDLKLKNVSWYSDVFYDVYPFTVGKPASKQIVAFKNDFVIGFYGGSLLLPNLVAQKKLIPLGFETIDDAVISTVVDQGLGFSFFLLDEGFVRMNASTLFTFKTVPYDNFFSYELDVSIPTTFSFYYFDLGFIYEFLHFDELNIGTSPKIQYTIMKPWSEISGRTSLNPDTERYSDLHAVEVELRWFFLREKRQNTSFFFSSFTQIGMGLSEMSAPSLHYEYGIGFGYLLLDVVPFTFQAGLDNNVSPVFKFSVVSKVIHSS